MKALKEIDAEKVIKFAIFGILQILYHLLIDHIFNIPQARKIFLQLLGVTIDKDSILMHVQFFNWHHKGPKGLKIGKDCFIGDETLIDLYDNVVLEDQVTIAQRVTILTHINVGYKDHPLQRYFPKEVKGVIFKEGCVIGAASTILPGITVGRQSFVAAGSVVTKNVPEKTLVAGVPAKIIRKISGASQRVSKASQRVK